MVMVYGGGISKARRKKVKMIPNFLGQWLWGHLMEEVMKQPVWWEIGVGVKGMLCSVLNM